MRFLRAEATNFGSYDKLSFEFKDLGLCLLKGASGAGKSTIHDLIPWVLFGHTSKGGKVDDVINWIKNETTEGALSLQLNDSRVIIVRRSRGKTPDLSWTSDVDYYPVRGKDLPDTQRLLNELLGFDLDTYLMGAYFNEFSPSSTFFMDKKSRQRETLESLVSLVIPIKLDDEITHRKRDTIKSIESLEKKAAIISYNLELLKNREAAQQYIAKDFENTQSQKIKENKVLEETFEINRNSQILELESKRKNYEEEKQAKLFRVKQEISRISSMMSKELCAYCGGKGPSYEDHITKVSNLETTIYSLQHATNLWDIKIDKLRSTQNPHSNKVMCTENPYILEIKQTQEKIEELHLQHLSLTNPIASLTSFVSNLNQLSQLSDKLRGVMIKNTIEQIQKDTNLFLEKMFDGEISVKFDIKAKDNIDVALKKNSYDCSYSQLSRGQRSMLKLCFSVAMMKAIENKTGVHFSVLFFDEVLDGLSSNLKVKALSIFQYLSLRHESVLVTDHATEIEPEFDTRFLVTQEGDYSRVEEYE